MCVCAHLGFCTRQDAHTHAACAHARTTNAHTPMESTRTLMHIHVLIHTYIDVHGDTRLVGARVCRSRRALTRTCAHAHALAWNLHVHTYACTCTHTYTYTHGDTHLEVARSVAPPLPPLARTRTRTHAQARARTHAEMHATRALRHTYMRAYTCR